MTRPCFDCRSLHWESWYIAVEDRDKIAPEDQFLGSACHSPNCGFCSSEIFRKRINRGRNESATTHCSSSRAPFSSWTKLNTRLYNPPRFSYFTPLSPLSSPTRKPFCLLSRRESHLPRTNDNTSSSKYLLSSWEGCLPLVNAQRTLSSSLFSHIPLCPNKVWWISMRRQIQEDMGSSMAMAFIHQSWQLVRLCFLFLGFLRKLLLILDSFSVLIPLPCFRHELFFTISFINFSPLCSDKCILVDRCTFNHVSWLKSCIQIYLLLKILSGPLRYTYNLIGSNLNYINWSSERYTKLWDSVENKKFQVSCWITMQNFKMSRGESEAITSITYTV